LVECEGKVALEGVEEDGTYKDELTAFVFRLSEFDRPSMLMVDGPVMRLRTASAIAVSLVVLVYRCDLGERG